MDKERAATAMQACARAKQARARVEEIGSRKRSSLMEKLHGRIRQAVTIGRIRAGTKQAMREPAALARKDDPELDGYYNLLWGKFSSWSLDSPDLSSADLRLLSTELPRRPQSATAAPRDAFSIDELRMAQSAIAWEPTFMPKRPQSAPRSHAAKPPSTPHRPQSAFRHSTHSASSALKRL